MKDLYKDISGRVWRLGNHVNTDLLSPPSCFSLDEVGMKDGLRQGMERLKSTLKGDYSREGLVIVAGENFGCGSSRETSVRALPASGVRAVVAKSFARIFYRSLVNLCIPPLVCQEIHDVVKDGDLIQVSIKERHVELVGAKRFPVSPFDPHVERILKCGGLVSYLEKERYGI